MINLIAVGVLTIAAKDLFAATYQVTFNGTWENSDIKPGAQYPSSAHFSPMIGVTHSEGAEFWRDGMVASKGVENVAEIGANGQLIAELSAAQNMNEVDAIFEFPSLFNLPNSASIEIEVNDDKPFVTMISMIAPSPDWFVGVSGLPLKENRSWAQNLTVELKPYDAGTEEGTQFSLFNSPSPSTDVISQLDGTTSPFLGRPTIGTLIFVLKEAPVKPEPEPETQESLATIGAIIATLLLDQ